METAEQGNTNLSPVWRANIVADTFYAISVNGDASTVVLRDAGIISQVTSTETVAANDD